MRTIDSIRRSGVGVTPDATVRVAAMLMEQTGVGSLAVVEDDRLLGIVTDRDSRAPTYWPQDCPRRRGWIA